MLFMRLLNIEDTFNNNKMFQKFKGFIKEDFTEHIVYPADMSIERYRIRA